MHTCITYSSCIILTPYFAAIIDSSGSSYVWGRKGGKLVRTDSILRPLCLKATPAEQTEEMEQQQPEGNWTLEDVKGALMDDMKVMMRDEPRESLIGLIPPPAPAIAILPTAIAPIAKSTCCGCSAC